MPRLGIQHLPIPQDRYRVDIQRHGIAGKAEFETESFARKEDCTRVKLVRRSALSAQHTANSEAATALADKLDYGTDGNPPQSMGSSLYMRDQRVRVLGAVWKLIVEGQ